MKSFVRQIFTGPPPSPCTTRGVMEKRKTYLHAPSESTPFHWRHGHPTAKLRSHWRLSLHNTSTNKARGATKYDGILRKRNGIHRKCVSSGEEKESSKYRSWGKVSQQRQQVNSKDGIPRGERRERDSPGQQQTRSRWAPGVFGEQV